MLNAQDIKLSHLDRLVELLNRDSGKKPDPKLAPYFRDADPIKSRQAYRYRLTEIVAPEAMIPWDASRRMRRVFLRDVICPYFYDQTESLHHLLQEMERITIETRWTIKPAGQDKGNLHLKDRLLLKDRAWVIEKQEFVKSFDGQVYHHLAAVLEADELSQLGRCEVCGRFFVRKREWQKSCTLTCTKKRENRLSADRKAIKRQAAQLKKKKQTERDRYQQLLLDPGFGKRLGGGPSKRHRRQAELLALLQTSSLEEFKRQLTEDEKRALEHHVEVG